MAVLRDNLEEIQRLRFVEKWSLRRIGEKYGVTRERVRQLIGNSGKHNGGFNSTIPALNAGLIVASTTKTNTELAAELGCSKGSISRYRAGMRHAVNENCAAGIGAKWEDWASSWLIERGIKNKLMPNHHPFDILALDKARIDVKVAITDKRSPSLEGKMINPVWHFNVKGAKKRNDTDFYMCIIADSEDVFIIPSVVVPLHMVGLVFVWPTARPELSKWQHYLDRYDLIYDFATKGRMYRIDQPSEAYLDAIA